MQQPKQALCIECYPEGGTWATLCDTHLQRMLALHHSEGYAPYLGEVTFEHTPTIESVGDAVLPPLYRSADVGNAIPELRGVSILDRSVLLHGPQGRGKTYQGAILLRHAIRLAGELGVPRRAHFQWVNVAELLQLLRASQRVPGACNELIQQLVNARALVLDDLGAEKPSEWVRERIYEVVNQRYVAELPVLVTTNLSPQQMEKQLGGRITGRIIEMAGADYTILMDGENHRQKRAVA